MQANDFVLWINGFFELTDLKEGEGIFLTGAQVKTIRDHISLVLTKVTPDRGTVADEAFPYIKKIDIPDNGTKTIPYTPYIPWPPNPNTLPYAWPNTGPWTSSGIVYC